MQIITKLKDTKLNNTAVTIGKFDGLHKGHNKLLNVLGENKENMETVVLTFAAKPIDVINHSVSKTLVTEEEKKLLCERAGIDYYASLPLTKEFLDMTPEAFVKEILVDVFDIGLIVCGPDFTFGKFGAGDVKLLEKMGRYYGYRVIVVEKEQYNNKDIGSTEIRERLVNGEIETVNDLLGHPYCIYGMVEHGKKLGRKIGLPTANIYPEENKLLPPRGVYGTILQVDDKRYQAISNIGINPTVESNDVIKVETHIIEENVDIKTDELYNKIIKVEFYKFVRPEKKFENVEELKTQIENDINEVKKSVAILK